MTYTRAFRGVGLVLVVSALAACGSAATPSTTSEVGATASADATGGTAPPRGGPAGSAAGASVEATFTGLAYAATSSSQALDLWLPNGATSPTPLVIYVHGGAFMLGDRSMVAGKVQALLDAGFAVASIDYRLSGEALFPAAVQDAKAAVRYLRANAQTYALDPDRFAVWGESAGANIAALVGASGDQVTVLDDPSLGNAEVSSAVQAVVDWYGPTDFLQMDAQASAAGCTDAADAHDAADSPESLYLGTAIQTAPDLAALSDPATFVATAGQLPAFSIAHGTADCTVPPGQSQLLADALTAVGQPVEVTLLEGATHADAAFDADLLAPTIAWLHDALA